MNNNLTEVEPSNQETENSKPLNILLVEDEPAFVPLIERALKGHRITVFNNVDQALEKLRESQKLGMPFDWIITDKGLVGEKDGFDLARVVKEEQLGNPFVTLFTASASEVQHQNSADQLRQKGIHQLVGKPLKRQEMADSANVVRKFKGQFQNLQTQRT